MKLMTFPEINDLENGQQISSFEGTVKKVFEQKSDIGQYGQWWLQNLILQDDHANELTVTWCCEDAFDDGCVGQRLHFEAGRDKKDQLAGIKRESRHKNGKKYESVKVDDRAKVKILATNRTTTNNATSRNDEIQDKGLHGGVDEWPEAPPNEPELPLPLQNGEGVQDARKHLMKACNLYNLCIKAAVTSICPNIPDEQRTNDQFQSTLASLWIEASSRRSTDGVHWWSYIDRMPEKPIQ